MPGSRHAPRRALPRARRAAFLVALGFACAPLDYTGKRCAADRPCPSGWTCQADGTCVASGGVNRVTNGGFEEGTAGWTVTGGTLGLADGGRGSAAAGLWRPGGGETSVLSGLAPAIGGAAQEAWHCAQAWVRGTDGVEVELQILADGEVRSDTLADVAGGTWTRVTTATMGRPGPLTLALVSTAAQGAPTLLVDDLALWDQSGPVCATAP